MGNQDQEGTKWSSVARLGFRFAFAYFVLYVPYPLNAFPLIHSVAQKYELLWHKIVPWAGRHILHLNREIIVSNNCSGDTLYDYLRVLCILSFAAVLSAVWSILDRSRANYQRLLEWLRLYVRLSLGSAMIIFGAGKIFMVQFPRPNLYKLLEPYGDFSPMSLLWTFMSASGYSIFTGWVQLLGGVLLFIPRLTTLGALVSLAASTNIFVLNLYCDVPVKLYSLHLLFFSFFLLLPDARRLIHFFLLNRTVEPSAEASLFHQRRLNTVALVVQLAFGAYLVCFYLYQARKYEIQHFAVATRPPFYGIWVVDEFTLGGKTRPPLLTDKTRWQKVVFQFPKRVGVQSMNGAWTGYWLREDLANQTLAMGKTNEPPKTLEFAFSSPDSQSLALAGNDGTNDIQVKLHRLDENQFTLLRSGFHWINEDADLVADDESVCDHVRRADSPLGAR